MNKPYFFIIDTTHPDFEMAKATAQAAVETYVSPASTLSWFYNKTGDKCITKVVGGGTDWFLDSPIWNGHPMILHVCTKMKDDGFADHSDLLEMLTDPEGEWYVESDDVIIGDE